MTQDELHSLVSSGPGNTGNICQIYAMRDGADAYDGCWCGFRTEDAMNVMSVTKGVMALLVGVAVDLGHIGGVEQKVLDFFPDYPVKRGERTIYDVTLEHLLTMTAPYKYRSEPWTKVCTSDDWTRAALDLLGGRGGVTGAFKYATLGVQILSGVIENAAGMRCLDFANRYLFAPLGIVPRIPHGDSSKEDQFDFLMNKGPRRAEWYCDPKGVVTAGWGLALSARDLARIGAMVAGGGVYRGRRVVSGAWIGRMTAPLQRLGPAFGDMGYGYLWYAPHGGGPVRAAIGDGGNVIYVDAERRIAVGVTGTFKPRIFDRIDFIERCVIPAVWGDEI